ncbi:MAG: YihY family inner membrane protein [Pseudomonadales bacterium]
MPGNSDKAAVQQELPQRLLRRLLEAIGFARYVVRRFIDDGCQQNAAALTYLSLFAIVPIMTVGFSLFSAVPAFESWGERLQNFVFTHFVPTTGNEVQTYLQTFAEQARSLTGIGVGFLAVTAYLTLKSVEKAFNKIWRTRTNRQGLNNFLLYWAILSLGPVLLGSGLVMTTYLAVYVKDYDALGLLPELLKYLPWLLTSLTFSLLFVAVPNCKVPLSHAFLGGVVTGALFEIAKNLFANVISNSSYELVYGTFATIPLFLIWIYFSWQLLLGGAEFVRALSSYKSRFSPDYPDLLVATLILHNFWQRQGEARVIDEQEILQEDWLFGRDINREQWERLRNSLLQAGILQITESGDYLLGQDLHRFTLWDLQLALNSNLRSLYDDNLIHIEEFSNLRQVPHWYAKLSTLINTQQSQHAKLFALPLAELFSEALETPASATNLRPV